MISNARRPVHRLSRLVLSVAVVLAALAGGLGVLSATAQGENLIYGCAHKTSGILRIVGGPGQCGSNEKGLTWSAGATTAAMQWNDIEGIPPGVESQVAHDVQCAGCVSSSDIADLSITADDLDTASVTTVKLADGSVTTDKLLAGSVTTAKLADESVTAMKLAWNSVNGYVHIQDETISTDDLANFSVTNRKLAAGSVQGGFEGVILDGSITADDLAEGSVQAPQIQSGAVGTEKLANSSVTSIKLADNAVAGNHVQDGSLTGVDIADGSVRPGNIKSNASAGTLFATLIITSGTGVAPNAVMVAADAVVECDEGNPGDGCNGTLSWQIVVNGSPTGFARSLDVSMRHAQDLQIIAQDLVYLMPGEHSFELNVWYSDPNMATVVVIQQQVMAVDLGRS